MRGDRKSFLRRSIFLPAHERIFVAPEKLFAPQKICVTKIYFAKSWLRKILKRKKIFQRDCFGSNVHIDREAISTGRWHLFFYRSIFYIYEIHTFNIHAIQIS